MNESISGNLKVMQFLQKKTLNSPDDIVLETFDFNFVIFKQGPRSEINF